MSDKIAGSGRKRPQLNIEVGKLSLDLRNPRLAGDGVGKTETNLIKILYEQYDLAELAGSMAKNGYFDEEPLVATPQKAPKALQRADLTVPKEKKEFVDFISRDDTTFTVVEGNRRLATVKLLLSEGLRSQIRVSKSFPTVSAAVASDLGVLPVIVYPHRDEVVPYLGVRHILGIEKWDPYAKALYIADLIEAKKSVEEVREQIGDKRDAVIKSYLSFKLLEQAHNEFDYDIKQARNKLSLLTLAIGQSNIKAFIGLPKKLSESNIDTRVPDEKIPNLRDLLSWIYGDRELSPVIGESRDITNRLDDVLGSESATVELRDRRNLIEAFELTSGEEKMVTKFLREANRRLERVLGIAHRHRTETVIEEAQNCAETADQLLQALTKNSAADG